MKLATLIEAPEQTLRRGYSITMNARNRTAKLRRAARAFLKVLSSPRCRGGRRYRTGALSNTAS
jgi:hypothetical protein